LEEAMILDLATEVQGLNAIGEPFLYRIGLAGLLISPVPCAFIDDARRDTIYVATAHRRRRMAVSAPSNFPNDFGKNGGAI
jgi:hypothetical protein